MDLKGGGPRLRLPCAVRSGMFLAFRKWPVKNNGNEHFAAIFWMRAGRPACICARITTALFSHRVRSHSSRALCARVPVCGGAF